MHMPTPANHRWISRSTLTGMLLILTACTTLQPAATLPASNTSIPTDSPVPTSELVPVEQVTDLPTHAPTSTAEEQPVATSILVSPEADQGDTAAESQNELDLLLGEAAAFGEADLVIKRPGHLSRITSPFLVIAYTQPGPDRLVQVTLLGEDGRILDSKKVRATEYLLMDNGNMVTELSFQVEGLSEVGRLEVSVTDEFGRVLAYNSVDLILLSEGVTDRNYTPQAQERIIIQYPLANYMVQGDTLLVSGLVRTSSEQPLTLNLIDESGNLIAEGSASVVLAETGVYGLFIGEIHFDVSEAVWVRLAVAIPGERIPGYEYIKTMELVISP